MPGRPGAPVVADRERQEVEHQVRVGDVVVAAREPAALEVVGGSGPAAQEQPLGPDERPAPFLGGRRLHRNGLEALVLDVDLEMILEMVADAREIGHDRDAKALEIAGRARARQEEELRRIDRAAAQDHLACVDGLRPTPLPLDLDADSSPAFEIDPCHERRGANLEVLPPTHDRVEVGARGAQPPAAMDVPVERREAFLAIAVDVLGQVVASLLGRGEEGSEQRVGRGAALQDQRTVVPTPRIVSRGREAVLHPLEVRQAVGVVPRLHAGIGRPALIVEGVAALEDLAVDARRAAQHLAPSVVDAPAVHERLGLRLVSPVVEAAADRERQGGRHVDERVDAPVRTPGFQDEHAVGGVRAEAIGQGTPRRAATDDDEVIARLSHRGRDASSAARGSGVPAHLAGPPYHRGLGHGRRPGAR